jgi:hypothetical protein
MAEKRSSLKITADRGSSENPRAVAPQERDPETFSGGTAKNVLLIRLHTGVCLGGRENNAVARLKVENDPAPPRMLFVSFGASGRVSGLP